MKKVIEYEPKVTQMKLEECEVCEGVGIIGADHPKNDAPHERCTFFKAQGSVLYTSFQQTPLRSLAIFKKTLNG